MYIYNIICKDPWNILQQLIKKFLYKMSQRYQNKHSKTQLYDGDDGDDSDDGDHDKAKIRFLWQEVVRSLPNVGLWAL